MKVDMYNFEVYTFLIIGAHDWIVFDNKYEYCKTDFERKMYETIKDVNVL